jgi:hypothetical protein
MGELRGPVKPMAFKFVKRIKLAVVFNFSANLSATVSR